MAIKLEKITPRSTLLDVRRVTVGHTTTKEWSCWRVHIIEVHDDGATVSWNGNRPERWNRRRVEGLYLDPPKGYRDQCERRKVQLPAGHLAPRPRLLDTGSAEQRALAAIATNDTGYMMTQWWESEHGASRPVREKLRRLELALPVPDQHGLWGITDAGRAEHDRHVTQNGAPA